VSRLPAGASLTRFVSYRAGAACSAHPTFVAGSGAYRAYERGARRAGPIDGVTRELCQTKLTPSFDHIRSWATDLPGGGL